MCSPERGSDYSATLTRPALALCVLATVLLPALALGQSSNAALEEIVVTAQRKVERVQDVPIAISAISSADLDARGVRQAGDIASAVPNLQLSLP